ncbi:MAG: universal stress protein UspA [Planctomyces sp.]|nr:universal stress protein UspA [Planctomyces sp.]
MAGNKSSLVVVPIDFSDNTPAVLEKALLLAGSPDDLRCIHILPNQAGNSPGAIWGKVDNSKRIDAVKKYFKEHYQEYNISPSQFEVRLGSAGFAIADYAEEINARLIVIASHGHHGLPKLLLGSVTERVIREAHCDVYVIRCPGC